MSDMNDREFVEWCRDSYVVVTSALLLPERDRILRLAQETRSISLKLLCDIATLRLDLKDAHDEIERRRADREDDKRIITDLKSERDAAEMIVESTRQLARDSVERALDQRDIEARHRAQLATACIEKGERIVEL
jgi:hypothetical protein